MQNNLYDKLWKAAIEELAEDFFHFFFPDFVHLIDFSKGFEFLDQEMALLFPETMGKDRDLDRLIKVYFKDGKEIWFLTHVEVQGYHEINFGERMFISFYRIKDNYQRNVVALAIYTDKSPGFKPNVYEHKFLDTEIRYKFRTYKVLGQDKEALKQSDNPFAMVILATLYAIEKGNANDEQIMNIKWDLVRLLKEKNYPSNKIASIFHFINHYIRFKDDKNYTIFYNQVQEELTNSKNIMTIAEVAAEIRFQESREEGKIEGREEGKIEGREEGKIEGREEGKIETLVITITNILTKHPDWEDAMIADLINADVELVKQIRAELATENE